jgi:hypothetical protein
LEGGEAEEAACTTTTTTTTTRSLNLPFGLWREF